RTPGRFTLSSPSITRTNRVTRGSLLRLSVRANTHAIAVRNTIGNAISASSGCPVSAGTSSSAASAIHTDSATKLRRRHTEGTHASNSSAAAARLSSCRCDKPPASASTPHASNTSNNHGTRGAAADWRWTAAWTCDDGVRMRRRSLYDRWAARSHHEPRKLKGMDGDNTPGFDCDVLVIGGGPGGSTISILLARRGWRVTMLEKAAHPRFHIGESLL